MSGARTTLAAVQLPFAEAEAYFKRKLNVPTRHWTDLMDEAHAHGFAVAGAASDALLADLRAEVEKAIKGESSLGDFRKAFGAIVQKHGWAHTGHADWRARVIYETNVRTAFAAGRYAQQTDPAVLAAFPYWEYVHTPVRFPRLMHVAWDGMVLRADDPWWDAHYPPNGWGCQCVTNSVSEGRLRRLKTADGSPRTGADKSPGTATRPWTNKRTGEVVQVPVGVDPGFAYNPGKAWKEGAALPVKAPALVPIGPREVVQLEAVTLPILRDFMKDPRGALEIGRLPDELRQALGAETASVLLSAETMRKQLGLRGDVPGHPELTAEDYLTVFRVIAEPKIAFVSRALHLGLITGDLFVVVKRTVSGAENFLQSLRRTDEKDRRRLLRAASRLLWKR